MINFKSLLLPVSVLLLSIINTAYAELPQTSDERIIQPPPGAKVAAAYFTLTNTSDKPLVINGVSGSAASHASVHLSSVVDDVARMEEQDSVTIDAGESLEFKHGSYHVMLMGLTEPLTPGNNFELVLDTNQGPLNLSIPVITPDEATKLDAMNHEGMNHDKHK